MSSNVLPIIQETLINLHTYRSLFNKLKTTHKSYSSRNKLNMIPSHNKNYYICAHFTSDIGLREKAMDRISGRRHG